MAFRSIQLNLPGLSAAGCCGALLMFLADLLLYFPASASHRTATHYFNCIDPKGNALHASSMAKIGDIRLMLAGALGPVAAVLYALGFYGLYESLAPSDGMLLPALTCGGLASMMVVGGCYHACFAYTGFIAKAFSEVKKFDVNSADKPLQALLARHQAYMHFIYKFAAVPGLVGSVAFASCCFTRDTAYPLWVVILVPASSGPIKNAMRRAGFGSLVLCGGLTNLWNLVFLTVTGIKLARR
jgi:hypothetical protein